MRYDEPVRVGEKVRYQGPATEWSTTQIEGTVIGKDREYGRICVQPRDGSEPRWVRAEWVQKQ